MSDACRDIVHTGFIEKHEVLKIEGLAYLSLCCCLYDKERYVDDLFAEFDIVCPKHLNNAVTKRKAEYLAGRYCASLALKNFGVTNFDIKIGKHRDPIWPEHLRGSITHTESRAYVVVAPNDVCHYLGIDYEKLMMANTAENIRSMIINDDEFEYLKHSFSDVPLALTLAFSAKESLFKALYPYVGRYFDFSAASIVKVSLEKQRFELRLNENLSKSLKKNRCFHGVFFIEPAHVLTLIAN